MAKKGSARAMTKKDWRSSQGGHANEVAASVEEAYALGSYDACYNSFLQYVAEDGRRLAQIPIETILAAAWAAYRINKFNAASDWLEQVSQSSISNDVRLLAALLKYEFREFQQCTEMGEALLHDDGLKRACSSQRDSRSLEVRFLNAMGMSHHNRGRDNEAITLLNRAIDADRDDPLSYINLATVFGHIGDVGRKRRTISEGLVHCSAKSDLQKCAAEFLGDETISLCMIVKNEEKMLAQCLESVSDVVDEIIVVDTGSEDRTVEIAEQFGARVYHHPWQNDFSLARNQSLSYATSDWILIMDADEVMVKEDHPKLLQATRIPDMNVISVSVHNQHLRTGDITSFLPSVRLWRRKLNAFYEGIVHNELRLPPAEPVLRADIRLIHYGYGLDWDMMKKKIARSKALLLKQLEDNPNNAFANFNYSQILRGEHKTPPPEVCREILDHSGKAVQNTDPTKTGQRHIHLMALDQMTSAYFYLHEYEAAEKTARRALEIEPRYLDALFALGNIYAGKRDFDQAISAYLTYINEADKYDPGGETENLILIHSGDQANAYFSMGLIHEERQQFKDAIACFERVLACRDDFADVKTHLAMLHFRTNNYDTARRFAMARLESEEGDLTARSILANIARAQGRLGDARSECLKILDREADNRQTQDLLVLIEKEAGDLESALGWVEKILQTNPDDYEALSGKAELLMGLARYQEAAKVYEHLQQAHPDDAEIANNLGNCYFKLQDYESAIRHYSRALAIEPQLAISLRNLGYTYFKAGDRANAVRKLTNYLDYVPEDFDILYLVSRLFFDLGEYADALRYMEKCIVLQPQSAPLVAFLADCYLKLGHTESARIGYQNALLLDPGYEPARIMLNELRDLAATSAALTRLAKQGAKA